MRSVLILLSLVVAMAVSAPTAAACVEQGTIFDAGASNSFATTGVQGFYNIAPNAAPNCGASNLVGGGTAHESTNGFGLVEVGWRDIKNSGSQHFARFFTESTIAGAAHTVEFSNGDLPAVNARCVEFFEYVWFKVVVAGGAWHSYYACSPQNYTDTNWHELLPASTTSHTSGSARWKRFASACPRLPADSSPSMC